MDASEVPNKKISFEFHGKAGEYFGIWIVNLLLTIVTLGIYTAWAKVRTNRYFYSKTILNNTGFAYLANPIAIFKGWLIAITVLIIYSAVSSFIPVMELVFWVLFIIILPFLVVRAMAFRARNSAYQNIRFNFTGSYWDATRIFIFWGIFGNILTLGLLFPYVQYLQTRFLVEKSGYGETDFEFKAGGADFYIVYLIAFAIMIVGSIIFGVVSTAGIGGLVAYMGEMTEIEAEQMKLMASAIMTPLMLIMYLVFFAYIQSRMGNLVWNSIMIKGNSFESTLRARDLMWIYFSNMIAIIASFGLLVPWAKVRTVRYRISKLQLLAVDNFDEFVQAEHNQVSALGEEMGDVFDMDIGI